MANPVLEIIEQVPRSERLGVVYELKNCQHIQEAYDVAAKHGISITPKQCNEVKAFLKAGHSDAELRKIVEAIVPKLMIKPALAALKAKLESVK